MAFSKPSLFMPTNFSAASVEPSVDTDDPSEDDSDADESSSLLSDDKLLVSPDDAKESSAAPDQLYPEASCATQHDRAYCTFGLVKCN